MNRIEVSSEDILLTGRTFERWGKRNFIVYSAENGIFVNTDYYEISRGVYICSSSYNRKLCDTKEEFLKISVEKIEIQAYGAYMDGAR